MDINYSDICGKAVTGELGELKYNQHKELK